MSRRNWVAPILSALLALALSMFILTSEGAERAQRLSLVYMVAGGIMLVLGLVLLGISARAKVSISNQALLGIILLLFAGTCFMLAEVQCQMQKLQETLFHPVTTVNTR